MLARLCLVAGFLLGALWRGRRPRAADDPSEGWATEPPCFADAYLNSDGLPL